MISRLLSFSNMNSRNLVKSLLKIPSRASSTSAQKLIDVKLDDEGIALMSWQRQKVNSLNTEFFQAIGQSVQELGKNEQCKGLIMTSSIPKIFSAGLDLNELYKPDKERLIKFTNAMHHVMAQIHKSDIITTVAINGYAAAGATILSLLCDYRVMVAGYDLAMNDTAVGIVPVWWVRELLIRAMGYRQAEIAITSSRAYTAEEALKVQLIDEIAADKEDAIEKCKKFIRLYDNIPRKIHSSAKRQLREPVTKYIEKQKEEDTIEKLRENFLNPYTQELLGKYLQYLKQKKAK